MHVTRQGANDVMTPESIQAMIDRAIQRNLPYQDDASQISGGGLEDGQCYLARVYSYTDFMKCQPLNFKGTEGVVGLSQWLEKMESVFPISDCAIDNHVRGNDVAAYTQRFQELAMMCTKFLVGEIERLRSTSADSLKTDSLRNVMSARTQKS
ncbi:hypothetical protein Tco_0271138 [Tanacetum coccineum]